MRIRTSRPVASHRPVAHGGWDGVHGNGGDVPRASGPGTNADMIRRGDSSRRRIIDFSSNVGPAGMPPSVEPILSRHLDLAARYPDPGCTKLVESLAAYTGLPAGNIVAGNGAVDLIYGFCRALLPGRRVLVQAPTFGEYEAASRLAGCGRITFHKSTNLAGGVDSFVSKIPEGGCVFVCNPNNPDGGLLSKTLLEDIISQARRKSCLVLVDECFIEMVPDPPDQSVLPLVKRYGNLLVLRSLTKSFGLAGLRVGYAAASRQITDILRRTSVPWSVNALAQHAGVLSLQDAAPHIKKTRSIIRTESQFLTRMISGIAGLRCHESSANFMLVRTEQDSAWLQARLLDEHGILVRDCQDFHGLDNHFIRIAVRQHRDNLRLVRALEAVLR